MKAIEVSGLRKSYGLGEVLRGVDFYLKQGEVFGLIGPNGADKTTVLKILVKGVEGVLLLENGDLAHQVRPVGRGFRVRGLHGAGSTGHGHHVQGDDGTFPADGILSGAGDPQKDKGHPRFPCPVLRRRRGIGIGFHSFPGDAASGVGLRGLRVTDEGPLLQLSALVMLGSLTFLTLGFLISSRAGSERSAGLVAQALAQPMLFLSRTFFPWAWIPTFLRVVARAFPLYYLGNSLRSLMVEGKSLAALGPDVAVLARIGLAAFVGAVAWFRWD